MRISSRGGFTMIELIVAIGLTSLVFVSFFSFFLYNTNVFTMANNEVTIQEQCSQILEILTVLSKESSDITQTPDFAMNVPPSDAKEYNFTREIDNKQSDVHVKFDPADIDEPLIINILDEVGLSAESYSYKDISGFSINKVEDNDRLREIVIVGRINKDTEQFSTVISMRNAP